MKKHRARNERRKPFLQFVKFNIVGVLNTAVDFLLFALLQALGVYFAVAQTISYCGGLLNSFLLNKRWTFLQQRAASPKEMVSFLLINLLSLACSILLIYLFHDKLQMPTLVSKLIATLFTVTVNFFGYRRWVFVKPVDSKD